MDETGGHTGGGVHDWSNIVHVVPKMFAEGGEAFDYFLNESKVFKSYKEESTRAAVESEIPPPSFSDVRLPPVKGSRALIVGTLSKIVLLNLSTYDRYLLKHSAQTKIDDSGYQKEANKMARTLLHGLRDKFVVAALGHAGMYMVCIGDPLVFVVNSLADRQNIHKVWSVVLEALDLMVVSHPRAAASPEPARNKWMDINPRAEYIFKDLLMQNFPEWVTEYEAWEVKTRRNAEVETFMALIREPGRRCMIAEMARDSRQKAIEKVHALRGDDCAGIGALQNAPVNTDTTESGIGSLDYLLYSTLANFQTCFGVSAAQNMMVFATDQAKVDKVNKKRKREDKVVTTSQWSLTGWYNFEKTKRREILRVISRGFDLHEKTQPLLDQKVQRDATYNRQLAARDQYLTSQMKKLLLFRRYKDVPLHTHASKDQFEEQWAAAGPTGHGIGEKNRLAKNVPSTLIFLENVPHLSNILSSLSSTIKSILQVC